MDGRRRMLGWISWFCSRRGNEFFCEVDVSYIQDTFSLTRLNAQVPHYSKALNLILDVESEDEEESSSDGSAGSNSAMVEEAAKLLYGLIHARYILTNRGIEQMFLKYKAGDFGKCPRHYCGGQEVLPIANAACKPEQSHRSVDPYYIRLNPYQKGPSSRVYADICKGIGDYRGLSDTPGESPVKLYCPKCKDVYAPKLYPRYQNADGAFFGTGFPHMLFFVKPHCRPEPPQNKFTPRLFGFKIHASVCDLQPEEEAISTAKDKTVARGQMNFSSTSESS